MLYARPCFTRGHGLGNRLFPWARARVFAATTGARFVTPVWTRLAVGPWLRGGIARRHYRTQILLSGLFRTREGDLGPLRGRLAARGALSVPEPDDPREPWKPPGGERDLVVEYSGWRDFFRPLAGRAPFLLDELRRITRPRWLATADRFGDAPVSMHVRWGPDFVRPALGARRIERGEATPLDWFERALLAIRKAAGTSVRALVVSDGTPQDLAPLLTLPDVAIVRSGCAISDLLVLSRARVLLASGSSSFSTWGAFLGGMPAASHPGQPLSDWNLPTGDDQPPRPELDPTEPDARFLEAASRALRGRGDGSHVGVVSVDR